MVTVRSIAVGLVLLLGMVAQAWADPSIPPLTGRVVDLAHILDQRTVDSLTRQLADHEATTTNQVVVVTLPGLQGYTIEQWGRALLNGWGIGQRDKNNGVVLVVAPNDRRLRIEVGYGLEEALSASAATNIVEAEIVPRFKRSDMTGGITAGVNAILQTIAGTYRPLPAVERSNIEQKDIWRYAPFVVFPLIFIAVVLINVTRGGGSGRRGRYYDNSYNNYGNGPIWNNDRGPRSSGFSRGGGGGGFSGGGGSGGGGGASGRW
ncbi:TPM domain-containing protein [Dongia sedimenti]|uniref:TPM domain-containing protein n=1 Tax=Dongia sedimenti TaxID=3064282 RepID=A0ABU0YLU1_9PROT|nr:TPM domain-containing protein [Rhodospirillaceae bacterium R-7]